MFPWNFFPFDKETKKMMQNMNPGEIEKYVHDMMKNIFQRQYENIPKDGNVHNTYHGFQSRPSSFNENSRENVLDANIFETHDYIFIMIPVRKEWLSNMRLYHTSNQVIIEHVPEMDNKHVYTLPAIVKKKGTTARFKDGLLEIKLLKHIEINFSEINITET